MVRSAYLSGTKQELTILLSSSPWDDHANMPNSQERKYLHAIQATLYNLDCISNFFHICWFEKINSLVIILNFTIEIQSIDVSILV
jgi:hypothetical protein